jgi:hypothetical protein
VNVVIHGAPIIFSAPNIRVVNVVIRRAPIIFSAPNIRVVNVVIHGAPIIFSAPNIRVVNVVIHRAPIIFSAPNIRSECGQLQTSHILYCSQNPYGIQSGISAYFMDAHVEINAIEDGKMGMRIHHAIVFSGLKGRCCLMSVLFEFQDGTELKDYNQNYCTEDGTVGVGLKFTPYDDPYFNYDMAVFIPYSELHLPRGQHDLRFRARIFEMAPLNKVYYPSISTSDYSYYTLFL